MSAAEQRAATLGVAGRPATLVAEPPVHVAVCIATFRRPELLAALLDSLGALTWRGREPRLSLLVVDNDAGETARAVVEAARRRLPLQPEYLVEPERNIARARNRAVAWALERGVDFVAFVDDDEVARPDWLDRLLEAQARYAADAVCGDVLPRFSARAPAWAARAGLFAQRLPRAGTPLPVASTNNALVAARLLRGPAPPFDPAFGVTGSSDSMFFLRAVREGARVVSAPQAVVEEHIPPARSSARWLTRRAFRIGNAAVFCERALPRPERRLGRRIAKASVRMGASAAALPVAALFGPARLLRALFGVCYGAGAMAALAGYRYAEYRELDR